MARSILAVIAGFALTGLLIGGTTAALIAGSPASFDARNAPTTLGMLLLMHAYVAVYATLGCWLAARLAPSRPMRHAMIVGVLGVLVNLANPNIWSIYPLWSNVVSITTPLLWGWLGGTIRERQLAGSGARAMAAA
jgi:hypothetical protein